MTCILTLTGILVYVAPTKALVNQIAAELQAQFSKNYKYPGKSVWAIHTRDYRVNDPQGCQILVTVPHILQIMLLAPSNAKSGGWSQRVKRIIFDEIHCIGQAEGRSYPFTGLTLADFYQMAWYGSSYSY